MSGCPGYVAPVQQPDDNEEMQEIQLGGGSCDDFAANPVKVATGNKYEKVSDVSISAPGIPLEFVRHYNSIMAADGALGHGWTHSFGINLQVVRTTPTIRIKIPDSDGRALYFSQLYYSSTGEINFYGESGVKDRLKQIISTGQYVLKRKSNLTHVFDSSGTLTQYRTPTGVQFRYPIRGGFLLRRQTTSEILSHSNIRGPHFFRY